MKTTVFAFLLLFSFEVFGQTNPVQNLTWEQWYEYPHNYFSMQWDEPAQPHDEIIGYAIYRNTELYRIQTERTLYVLNTPLYGYVTNCGEDFLMLEPANLTGDIGFEAHVVVVYAPNSIESSYNQTVTVHGPALNIVSNAMPKLVVYPNPTHGILHVETEVVLEHVIIYDLMGKEVLAFSNDTQIDLSSLSKGLYIMKCVTAQGILVNKIGID
jgi:hypothetical protein